MLQQSMSVYWPVVRVREIIGSEKRAVMWDLEEKQTEVLGVVRCSIATLWFHFCNIGLLQK